MCMQQMTWNHSEILITFSTKPMLLLLSFGMFWLSLSKQLSSVIYLLRDKSAAVHRM